MLLCKFLPPNHYCQGTEWLRWEVKGYSCYFLPPLKKSIWRSATKFLKSPNPFVFKKTTCCIWEYIKTNQSKVKKVKWKGYNTFLLKWQSIMPPSQLRFFQVFLKTRIFWKQCTVWLDHVSTLKTIRVSFDYFERNELKFIGGNNMACCRIGLWIKSVWVLTDLWVVIKYTGWTAACDLRRVAYHW